MSDQASQAPAATAPITVASAVAANQPISRQDAVAALRNSRAATGAPGGARPNPAATDAHRQNPISEAARALGQHAAKARQERQAEAANTQQAPIEEQEQNVEDDPAAHAGETRNELNTADDGQPIDIDTGADEDEPADDGQTIDLGDGVRVTVDEVRDGFMMKADHTRKTQALAEDRKAFEAHRTQRQSELDQLVQIFAQKVGQPKSLKELLAEDPHSALERMAEQEENQKALAVAFEVQRRTTAEATQRAQAERDSHLAETYNKAWSDPAARDKDYTALTAYGLKLGADPKELGGMNKPWMIQVLDKAAKYDALQAGKGKVTQLIADKPRVTKPGVRVSKQAAGQASVQQAHAKLKSSGNLSDAVALLRTLRAKARAG